MILQPSPKLCRGGALLLLGSLLGGGCAPMSFLVTPVPAPRALQEQVVRRESLFASQRIAVIEIDGMIQNGREQSLAGATGENPVALFKEKLDKAGGDSRVRAVVLRINSPGGTVTASDIMHGEVVAFRKRTGKPVIASMLDVAASGGYYVACACDRIYAHPTTVTGSIGVIALLPDFSGTMQKLGIAVNAIKSGAMKDSGSPFREMTEADRAVFQKMINDMYERFLAVVHAGRPGIAADELRKIADGRIYMADDARRLGLIDTVGGLEDAITAAREAAGIGATPIVIVQYAPTHVYRPNIYAHSPDGPTQVNLVHLELPALLKGGEPQFLYLWSPGW
ncbi:putative signal peptide peptidase SppA [Phycisphaerae bacterium RAS1]|nr:putative signal peptide peptidase SppA [Phycisphaerae bacterium RAS1]